MLRMREPTKRAYSFLCNCFLFPFFPLFFFFSFETAAFHTAQAVWTHTVEDVIERLVPGAEVIGMHHHVQLILYWV